MTTAFFRTVILYFVLMLGLRLMGKRQIGELEPSELVLTLLLSDLASVPMQDFGIPLAYGLLPIAVLLCLSMLLSFFSLKSIRFRSLLCGRPAIIIREGKLAQVAMLKNRLTVDELFEQLRGQGISQLSQVKYAILETSGKLSILPYAKDSPLTPAAAGVPVGDDVSLPLLIINDGRVLRHNLKASGYNERWLLSQLARRRLSSPRQVFLLTVDNSGAVTCVPKEAAV